MAIAAPTAGNRIVTSDVSAFYNLLKGVSGSGEAITLIYNAAGSVILQPSSDPAAGTEAIQIKNNAGTVQGALTFDGKVKVADGTAALPSLRFESEASGLYLSAAGVVGVSASGATTNILMRANAVSIGATPSTTGHIRLTNTGSMYARNAANGADLNMATLNSSNVLQLGDSGDGGAAFLSASLSVGTTPATTGAIRVPNASLIYGRNALNSANLALLEINSSNDVAVGDGANALLYLKAAAGGVNFAYATTALGAGGAATLGLTGGSGPATTTQNSWLKIAINGTASYLPVWR